MSRNVRGSNGHLCTDPLETAIKIMTSIWPVWMFKLKSGLVADGDHLSPYPSLCPLSLVTNACGFNAHMDWIIFCKQVLPAVDTILPATSLWSFCPVGRKKGSCTCGRSGNADHCKHTDLVQKNNRHVLILNPSHRGNEMVGTTCQLQDYYLSLYNSDFKISISFDFSTNTMK